MPASAVFPLDPLGQPELKGRFVSGRPLQIGLFVARAIACMEEPRGAAHRDRLELLMRSGTAPAASATLGDLPQQRIDKTLKMLVAGKYA